MHSHSLRIVRASDSKHCATSFFIFSLFLFMVSATAAQAENTYLYDNYDRLYRVHSELMHIQYDYDDAGNRIAITTTISDYDFDGITDGIENSGCTSYLDADSDDDGISDGVEDANHNGVVDAGETDPCDNDTDNDGIQDGTELGYTTPDNPDTGDTFQPDLDPTSTTNPLDADSDNDWIPDGEEDTNHNGMVDSGESDPLLQDTTDTDSDGLFDALENQTCSDPYNPDTDGDTLSDGDEDSNHNGVKDQGETSPCNEDTDNDGLRDDVDPEPTIHINGGKMVPQFLLLLLEEPTI